MEFSAQYSDGDGGTISLGMVSDWDVEFLRNAAIGWPELTNMILKTQARGQTRYPGGWPGITELENRGSGPYPDQGNQEEE